MRWTCQTQAGSPLWWRLERADHWYRPDTDPEVLADDYLRAHPHHQGEVLVLTCWRNWGAAERQVLVGELVVAG